MGMDTGYKNVIKKQEEMITLFQVQLATDQKLIDAQKETIQAQGEKIAILEEEVCRLKETGDQLAATAERLEKICTEQQELIESMSKIFTSGQVPRQ